jgi:tetratricopeptide (TPR) repeat protein
MRATRKGYSERARQEAIHPLSMRTRLRAAQCLYLAFHIVAFCSRAAFGAPGQSSAEAREHAQRGLTFARLNDLKGAEAEFRRAVDLSPRNVEYLTELGGILGMQRKLEDSTVYFEKALKLDPTSSALRRNVASNQWQMGRFAEARENLKRVLAAKPGDTRTILMLGMVAESLKDYSEAARLLESVQSLVKEQPESIAALARVYYHAGQKEKARNTLNQLLANSSGDRGLFLGAQAAATAEDYETAETLFRSIRSAYPDPATLGYQTGLVQYRAGHFDRCQNTLAGLLSSSRASIDTYNLLALCYHKQGRSAEAIRILDESIERIPHTEADYLKLGNMLLENRIFAAAHETAKRAVALAPNSERAYQLKGTVELDLNFYKDAIQSFSRALQLDPSSAEAHLGLAMAQWGAGKTSEATASFEEGIRRFPRDSPHYTKYARMLLELGAQIGDSGAESHAVLLLQKAISLNPSQPDAHYELGNLALSKGNTRQAVQELEAAAKLDPGSSSTRYALSRAYRRLGRNEEASKEMQVYNKLKAEEDATP